MPKIDPSPEDKAVIQSQIASALRCAYEDTLNEPLPDQFVALLEQLGAQEEASGGIAAPEKPA
ncbi:MAG: NepR family anti-sigma factor [Methylocystis sp.]|uniref:NepR family anti-sigma factor n=1 Tax=Methylocystis sp. TaxID=1911079 RepID=UPI003DA638AA